MAKRALKLSEVATLSDSVIETDEAMERMETDEPESLTEYRIKQAPDASANRRRTTPEQRAAILQDLADGMSRKDASVKHNTTYGTIINIEKAANGSEPSVRRPRAVQTVPESKESPLRREIYLIGFAYVLGDMDSIDEDRVKELRAEIEEVRKQRMVQFALTL